MQLQHKADGVVNFARKVSEHGPKSMFTRMLNCNQSFADAVKKVKDRAAGVVPEEEDAGDACDARSCAMGPVLSQAGIGRPGGPRKATKGGGKNTHSRVGTPVRVAADPETVIGAGSSPDGAIAVHSGEAGSAHSPSVAPSNIVADPKSQEKIDQLDITGAMLCTTNLGNEMRWASDRAAKIMADGKIPNYKSIAGLLEVKVKQAKCALRLTEKRILSVNSTQAEIDSNLDGIRLTPEFANLPSVIKLALNKKRLLFLLGEGLQAFKPPHKVIQFIMAVTYRHVNEDRATLVAEQEQQPLFSSQTYADRTHRNFGSWYLSRFFIHLQFR